MIQPKFMSAFLAAASRLKSRTTFASHTFATQIAAGLAILIALLGSSVARADSPAQPVWSHSVIAATASVSPSNLKMPVATYALAPAGDRFVANLGTDSGQALGLGGANGSDNEASVVASRAAIWPIPGALILFAIVLAGLNTRRGRKTSSAVQGF